ncbi:MAG: DUF3192 domain-containing protein [Idiomarina sp.]|nr:DUF3192 domain-containing protein [Idiomarina sp.]
MLKGFLIAAVGFLIYAIIAAGILTFYTANPENMTWREREIFNRKYIGRLELGTERDEVLRLLGPPDISEAITTARGELLILFYRTHHVRSDGMTTRDETTPLIFESDRLVAWGDPAYLEYTGQN